MIYIKLEEKEIRTKLAFLGKFLQNLKNKYGKLEEKVFEDKKLIVINNVHNLTLNKLSLYIKKNCINRVCLSNNLLENDVFRDFIIKQNVKILDGKWLFKHLVFNSIEYVCKNKKENVNYQEVSFLTNTIDDSIVQNIRDVSSNVRILNIITKDEKKFRKIEKELYEENGIILNMNNNYKKSLSKSDIIINFDFNEEELNKYCLPKKTCLINLSDKLNINTKSFEGINAHFFEITMPRKYLKNSICLSDFDNAILYESYIYKNTSSQNIKKELEKDEINISFLIGKNGRIRKNEYLKLKQVKN